MRLNGKSWSQPLGMVFKKYHCAKCGAKLEKERTHRVVTKDDKDYYRYHDYGKGRSGDYDVYDYRFKCPECGERISYDAQCIIERIQKKQGRLILSSSEIKSNYEAGKKNNQKRVLLKRILIPVSFILIANAVFYIFGSNRSNVDLTDSVIFSLISIVFVAIHAIMGHKGKYPGALKYSYPYEKEAQLKKLHTYSVHNRSRIEIANNCYCFGCNAILDNRKIKEYTDNGQTAICPKCGNASIIPDSIEESLDEKIMAEMHEYWF